MTKTKSTKTWIIALVAVLTLGVGLNSESIVQTVKAQVAAIKALANPVTVYDDLYVAGSGTSAEPGDLMVEGKIYGWGNGQMGDLTVDTPLHVNGGLEVYGTTQFLMGETKMESALVSDGVNVLGGNLNVANGTVKATGGIGRFYTTANVESERATSSNQTIQVVASCSPGDVAISCNTWLSDNFAHIAASEAVNITTCSVQAQFPNTGHYVRTQAICFSPDG